MMSKENGTAKSAVTRNRTVIFASHECSLLSELFHKDKNFRAVCQVVMFTGLLSIISSIVTDSLQARKFHWKTLDYFDTLSSKSLIITVSICFAFHLAAFAIHPLFKLWVYLRVWSKKLVDLMFIVFYVFIIFYSFAYTVRVCTQFELPSYLKIIISTEQVRLCMKSYSFIRENAYKVLYPWHKDDTTGPAVWYAGQMSPTVGSFSQYCYFLFAPTLLYRDHYPRSPGPIKFKSVLVYFTLFLYSVAVLYQVFGALHIESFGWREIVLNALKGLPYGVVFAIMLNLCVMHAWMNLGAELTRFGDRRFYEDWWSCENYLDFYRKWNIVPYHYNHQYIYNDIRKVTKNKYLALFLLFLTSSFVHEYVLGLGLGQGIPLLTIMFAGIGVLVIGLGVRGTFVQIFSLSVGLHILFWNLALEASARRVCHRPEETFIDHFYPRLFECLVKHNF